MKKSIFFVLGIFILLLILLASDSFYSVSEWEQAVVTQFGKPVGKPIVRSGLYFKTPFIQKVHKYDKRLLRWDGDPKEIPTRDKRFIWVDTTARWRIKAPLKFLQVIGTYEQAYRKLDDTIGAVARDYVSANPLVELVRSSNHVLEEKKKSSMGHPFSQEVGEGQIVLGREKITRAILLEASKAMPEFGMELVDVRIKRLNYVERVREKVYERMISERKRTAAQYRSEGEGKKAEILGQMEKELKSIRSDAYRTAEEIHGVADAQATKIYGDAYNKDPGFYAFSKTLDAYRAMPFKNSIIILSTNSDFYHFIKNIPGIGKK